MKTYGDYDVSTTFPKDIEKQQEVTFSLSITKNTKPATNLENYLGAFVNHPYFSLSLEYHKVFHM